MYFFVEKALKTKKPHFSVRLFSFLRNGRVRNYAVFDLIDRYFLSPGNLFGNRIF